jgi:hypothetical protein
MTVESARAERVLNDAFSRFKQSHAEITLAIATIKLSLSERRAACPASGAVADGKPAPSKLAASITADGSDCRSFVPGSPSASLIPTVDMLE